MVAPYKEQQHEEMQQSVNTIGRQPISTHAMFIQLTDNPNEEQLLHCHVEPCIVAKTSNMAATLRTFRLNKIMQQ